MGDSHSAVKFRDNLSISYLLNFISFCSTLLLKTEILMAIDGAENSLRTINHEAVYCYVGID
jgi:hypothetical protein